MTVSDFSYILLFKPYGMLSQFTREAAWKSLADLDPLPPAVRAAGRLDVDSEGLLLLTNDPHVIHRLTTPRFRHSRTYLVQVEGVPSEAALAGLRTGVALEKKTLPAGVRRLTGEPDLPPRGVPIRLRKSVPTTWLELTLHEGRNRQVRRMTARVGHPTLRLVRTAIGPLRLGSLHPGDARPLTPHERAALFSALGPRPATPERKRPPGRPGGRSARSF
jgi:23S rRNA pseudouridine2457 synthase